MKSNPNSDFDWILGRGISHFKDGKPTIRIFGRGLIFFGQINIKKQKGLTDMAKITQTAGRDALGEFAPDFAHFNDDILFGENWNNEDIDLKTRCIVTVVALMAQGITDSSLKYHLQNAKANGVTKKEIAAVVTHAAFYAGWPKAWAVFNLAKEVWDE